MKIYLLIATMLISAGCASTANYKRMTEGAANCNSICKDNPEVGEYSHKGGGGVTLLFMGGFEEKCGCARSNK